MARILVVDDEMEIRQTLKKNLETENHDVTTAGTVKLGIDALKIARKENDAYHVVLIDLKFENYDGSNEDKENAGMLVLNEALNDRFIEPIIMTAYPSTDTAKEAVAKGVFRYLIKGDNKKSEDDRSSLLKAVRLAIENYENIHALYNSIEELQKIVSKNATPSCSECGLCIELAKQSFNHIMKFRGRQKI